MSRKGNCLDTAMVESFFGHLKEEFYRHKRFSSPIEFTTELDTYIHWYNHVRIREQLQGLSPVQYRAQFRQSSGTAVIDKRTAEVCTERMASVATDARLRIAVGLIVIALAIASLLMVWRPETETWFRNVQTLMCGVLLVWGATILVGKTEAGRLVLTRRRWRYFTLLGVVMGVASLFVVTSVIMARPGGNAVWPLFPSVISLFVAQLYEPESGAQFRASDLTDRDARLWKRIALLSTVIGAILVCIAAIAGAVGNIGVLAFLLPIGVLFLVFAAALWTMLRLRDRQLRAKP